MSKVASNNRSTEVLIKSAANTTTAVGNETEKKESTTSETEVNVKVGEALTTSGETAVEGVDATTTESATDKGAEAVEGEIINSEVVEGDIASDEIVVDKEAVEATAGMEGEVGIDPVYEEGTIVEPGMDPQMGTIKDPLLSSWVFIIGITVIVLVVSVGLGTLLARLKIKKGIELYED